MELPPKHPLPLVDVIIATYNQSEFLVDAIESVFEQTYPHINLIIVDDGSTDATALLLQSYQDSIACIWQENAGASAARNTGIRQAQGDFLLFLDADDYLLPSTIQAYVNAAQQSPHGEVFYGRWQNVNRHKEILSKPMVLPLAEDPFHRILEGYCPAIHAVFMRHPVLELIGGFDERLQRQEDWDLWLRIAATGKPFIYVPEAVSIYRRYAHMHRANSRQSTLDGLNILKKTIDYHQPCEICRDLYPRITQIWREAHLKYLKEDSLEHLMKGQRTLAIRYVLGSLVAQPGIISHGIKMALRRLRRCTSPSGNRPSSPPPSSL